MLIWTMLETVTGSDSDEIETAAAGDGLNK
jgi:hypothetical protein